MTTLIFKSLNNEELETLIPREDFVELEKEQAPTFFKINHTIKLSDFNTKADEDVDIEVALRKCKRVGFFK